VYVSDGLFVNTIKHQSLITLSKIEGTDISISATSQSFSSDTGHGSMVVYCAAVLCVQQSMDKFLGVR